MVMGKQMDEGATTRQVPPLMLADASFEAADIPGLRKAAILMMAL